MKNTNDLAVKALILLSSLLATPGVAQSDKNLSSSPIDCVIDSVRAIVQRLEQLKNPAEISRKPKNSAKPAPIYDAMVRKYGLDESIEEFFGGPIEIQDEAKVEFLRNFERLKIYGLKPLYSFEVGGGKITVSDIYPSVTNDAEVLAVVEVNGKRFLRVFYLSISGGEFRVLPFTSAGWKSKGLHGEDSLRVPGVIQSFLLSKLKNNEILRFGLGRAPVPELPEGAYRDPKRPENDVDVILLNPKVRLGYPGVAMECGVPKNPRDVVITEQAKRPDFYSPPRRRYQTPDGEAIVYPSYDDSLEYTIIKDSEGKIYFSGVEDPKSPLNNAGARRKHYQLLGLFMPRAEYTLQIPENFRPHSNSETTAGYADAWAYLREIPEIQEYYRATARGVVPGVERQDRKPVDIPLDSDSNSRLSSTRSIDKRADDRSSAGHQALKELFGENIVYEGSDAMRAIFLLRKWGLEPKHQIRFGDTTVQLSEFLPQDPDHPKKAGLFIASIEQAGKKYIRPIYKLAMRDGFVILDPAKTDRRGLYMSELDFLDLRPLSFELREKLMELIPEQSTVSPDILKARKGWLREWSFDLFDRPNGSNATTQLVAAPKTQIRGEQLPDLRTEEFLIRPRLRNMKINDSELADTNRVSVVRSTDGSLLYYLSTSPDGKKHLLSIERNTTIQSDEFARSKETFEFSWYKFIEGLKH